MNKNLPEYLQFPYEILKVPEGMNINELYEKLGWYDEDCQVICKDNLIIIYKDEEPNV